MKRIAFTIILNGLHHLLHKNQYNNVADNVDLWVIVEGVANPGGSTSWCKTLDDTMHRNFLSNDGTTEFLDANKRDNVIIVRPNNRPWSSKDEQVNAAITEIRKYASEGFLWQIDVDEQWTPEQLKKSEEQLVASGKINGVFRCNCFVGPKHIALGEWGEGNITPYMRLWIWKGENFKTHEPPVLDRADQEVKVLSARFCHYSYYFEQDVWFKEKYYQGYTGLVDRWRTLQNSTKPTTHISDLLGHQTWWGHTNTIIRYIP